MTIYHFRVGKGVSYRNMVSEVQRAQNRNPFYSLFAKKDNPAFSKYVLSSYYVSGTRQCEMQSEQNRHGPCPPVEEQGWSIGNYIYEIPREYITGTFNPGLGNQAVLSGRSNTEPKT